MTYYVYIITNYKKTVLYTGITNNLTRRILEHYSNRTNQATFSGKYSAFYLLHYEEYPDPTQAIRREKEIKGWTRVKKEALIVEANPTKRFLNQDVFDGWPPEGIKS